MLMNNQPPVVCSILMEMLADGQVRVKGQIPNDVTALGVIERAKLLIVDQFKARAVTEAPPELAMADLRN